MNELDDIRAREAAATPGPWTACDDERTWSLHAGPMQILKAPKCNTPYAEYWPEPADAAFIVSARQDMPYLLAMVDRLSAENQRLVGAAVEAKAEAELQEIRRLRLIEAAVAAGGEVRAWIAGALRAAGAEQVGAEDGEITPEQFDAMLDAGEPVQVVAGPSVFTRTPLVGMRADTGSLDAVFAGGGAGEVTVCPVDGSPSYQATVTRVRATVRSRAAAPASIVWPDGCWPEREED